MVIYGDERSGNCLKVKYTADALGLGYDWHAIDIMAGESRSTEFLAQNPQGQVPVVVLASGEILAQSNAIIRYLANGSALLPARPLAQAKVDDWLFWEQYSHEPYVAVCRFQMLYQSLSADQREPERVRRSKQRWRLWIANCMTTHGSIERRSASPISLCWRIPASPMRVASTSVVTPRGKTGSVVANANLAYQRIRQHSTSYTDVQAALRDSLIYSARAIAQDL